MTSSPQTSFESENQRLRVQLTDDEHPMLDMLTNTLESAGYVAHPAGSGKEALQLPFARPDVILLWIASAGHGWGAGAAESSPMDHGADHRNVGKARGIGDDRLP